MTLTKSFYTIYISRKNKQLEIIERVAVSCAQHEFGKKAVEVLYCSNKTRHNEGAKVKQQ
jgi:hypothetical protein